MHVGAGGGLSFTPSAVTVNAGDIVMWVWDAGPHTVTSGAAGAADGRFCSLPSGQTPSAASCNSTSYAAGAGTTYAQTFNSAGTFPYFCTVHGAMMTGTVTVNASGGGTGGGTGGTGDGGY